MNKNENMITLYRTFSRDTQLSGYMNYQDFGIFSMKWEQQCSTMFPGFKPMRRERNMRTQRRPRQLPVHSSWILRGSWNGCTDIKCVFYRISYKMYVPLCAKFYEDLGSCRSRASPAANVLSIYNADRRKYTGESSIEREWRFYSVFLFHPTGFFPLRILPTAASFFAF